MRWWRKQGGDDGDARDAIWNRAAMESGGPDAREGDQSLASLLRLHNEAMSSGLLHAVSDGLTRGEFDRALEGCRYFGLPDAAVVAEAVLTDAFHASEEELDVLEADADRRYSSVVRDDSVLTEAFATKLSEAPQAFAPVGE